MSNDLNSSRQKALLGKIAPTMVFVCLLLDISLRFVPPRVFAFRASEALTIFASGNAPYVPNSFYRNERSFGDLPNFANLPRTRHYREEVFTTDANGYRNRRKTAKPFEGIVLLGDSFSTSASGIRDEQTLSEQLGDLSGCSVYNGGSSPEPMELLSFLQMNHGLVIWEQSERTALSHPSLAEILDHELSWNWRPIRRILGDERVQDLRGIIAYSPLEIVLGRAVKLLQNDEIFPNPYRGVIAEANLRNGQEMLFLQSEVENYELDRPTDPAFFVARKKELQEKSIDLIVLLVPDKYVVYHDLLSPAPPGPDREPFLNLVEKRLVGDGVPVVNLTPIFRERARALIDNDKYLYSLDDTHWNAEGIHEAAESIVESQAFLGHSCRAK
jgi:hypothetical protein